MSRDRDMVDLERSSRSVFVGNIPYEATEEKLREVFSEVGPVVSFRLVNDRESGKPKGYGFAEYQDMETALSAMRNLNNRELLGRALRVDHATSEKNRIMDDLHHIGGHFGPPKESPHGEPVPAKDAPEAISKAVASLPPEQMFELMKQMKQCIQNNPVEARNMLLQNPQLAYALLQAQVVMRIVDPEIAMKMLHRQNPVPTLMSPAEPLERPSEGRPIEGRPIEGRPIEGRPIEGRPNGDGRALPFMEPRRVLDEPMDIPRRREVSPMGRMDLRGPLPPMRGPPDERLPMDIPMDRGRGEPMGLGPRDGGPMGRGRGEPMGLGPRDGGPMDRGRGEPMGLGPRDGGPMNRGRGEPMGLGPRDGGPMDRGRGRPMGRRSPEPFERGPFGHPDLREPRFPDRGPMDGIPGMGRLPLGRGAPPMDRPMLPRDRGGPPFHEGRGGPPPRMPDQERGGMGGPVRDMGPGPSLERPAGDPRRGPAKPANEPPAPGPAPGGDPGNPDQEKAALIMQVLQLTPEQIAMLPEEQRKSILILKEQITGGRQ